MIHLDWTYLGLVPYRRGLELQYAHADAVMRGAAPRLFLLQHPPTVTLGRHADPANVRWSPAELHERGFEIVRVKRGGDVTYHGPGQLVGYPVADLDAAGCSVPRWVRGNTEALIEFLAFHGIRSCWSDTHPGVWVRQRKIGAVGFHLLRRVSTHGFALNITTDLAHFDSVIPCGLRNLGVTSMAEQLPDGGSGLPSLAEAAERIAGLVAKSFGWRLGERLDATRILEKPSHASFLEALA